MFKKKLSKSSNFNLKFMLEIYALNICLILLYTVKPVYLEHVDNWFLKLVLYYLNKYIFKNHLSTCSR
jgi:hypothetical protein